MMRVLACIGHDHDLRLVALALVVALLGSAATLQTFRRIALAPGHSRTGWIGLTAVGVGTSPAAAPPRAANDILDIPLHGRIAAGTEHRRR